MTRQKAAKPIGVNTFKVLARAKIEHEIARYERDQRATDALIGKVNTERAELVAARALAPNATKAQRTWLAKKIVNNHDHKREFPGFHRAKSPLKHPFLANPPRWVNVDQLVLKATRSYQLKLALKEVGVLDRLGVDAFVMSTLKPGKVS
jgi:K+-sensing histidine kinase KdpD